MAVKLSKTAAARVAAAVKRVERTPPPDTSGGEHRADRTPPNPLFVVTLSNPTGSAGSKTTAVAFVYDVATLAGGTLATAKAPAWPSRSENGLRVAATTGLAYFDNSGNLQLAIAFERSGTGGC